MAHTGPPEENCTCSFSSTLKFVFIHIPKCAGTSIHDGLLRIHQRLALVPDAPAYFKHEKASRVRALLGPAWWDGSFRFALVRNPWDVMVSSYHWWIGSAGSFPHLHHHARRIEEMGSFAAFMRSEYGTSMINEVGCTDMLEWICEDGQVIVDFIGRYERLDDDWQEICRRIGVEPIELLHKNRSSHEGYRDLYDDASRRLVADRFQGTIEKFGYRF
jgi:Sulfotransferase family